MPGKKHLRRRMPASIHSYSDDILLSSNSRSLIIKQTTPDWSMYFEGSPCALIFQSKERISICEESVAEIQVIDNNGTEICSGSFPLNGSRFKWKLRIDSFLSQFLQKECDIMSTTVCSKVDKDYITEEANRAYEMEIRLYSRPCLKLESVYSIHSGILQVDSTIIDISKEYLSLHSEYFTMLFYGNFREKSDEIINIKEIEYDDFILFIQSLYQKYRSYPDVPTALNQLDLSDRFIVPIIHNSALSYLLKTEITKTDIPHGLLIADRVKSEELLVHVLSFTTDIIDLLEISNQIVRFIDNNTVQKLFNLTSTLVNNLKENSSERTSRLEEKLKEETSKLVVAEQQVTRLKKESSDQKSTFEAQLKEYETKLLLSEREKEQNAMTTQILQAWRTACPTQYNEYVLEFYENRTPYKVQHYVIPNTQSIWHFIPSKYSQLYIEGRAYKRTYDYSEYPDGVIKLYD